MFQPFLSCERFFFIPTLLILFPTMQHPWGEGRCQRARLDSVCKHSSDLVNGSLLMLSSHSPGEVIWQQCWIFAWQRACAEAFFSFRCLTNGCRL